MKRLKELRQDRGYTQKQLAEIIGESQSSLARWELGTNGEYNEVLIKIAKCFQVSVDYLIGNSDYEGNISYSETNLTGDEVALLRRYRMGTFEQKKNVLAVAETLTKERE